MDKVVFVDFESKHIVSEKEHNKLYGQRIGNILKQVQQEISEDEFIMYVSVIEDWLRRTSGISITATR